MKVSLVVAVAANNVIGKDNKLIWHLPADMKFFRETTMNHCIITGRKNYESIPDKFRPLPGRTNVVITRQKDYSALGAHVVHSIDAALDFCGNKNEPEIFVIGGAQIFREMLEKNMIHRMYITHIRKDYSGDVYFPEFDPSQWEKKTLFTYPADEKNEADMEFCQYDLIRR